MIQFEETTNLVEVLCALNDVYEKQMDPLMVQWLDNCPTGSNRWFVAREHNQVVGIYGLLPRYMVVNGIVVRAHLCNNVGVKPFHRSKGLFKRLGIFATEQAGVETDLFIGCSNPAALRGHLAAGWSHIADLALMYGVVDGQVQKNTVTPYHERPIVDHRSSDRVLIMKRDDVFRDWRYSREGIEYMSQLHKHHWAVWKRHHGRCQVMEMSGWSMLKYLNWVVDLWAVSRSVFQTHLFNIGFKSAYTRHLVIKPNGFFAKDPNAIRFELVDNDVY
jgi:hypothetical protein